MFISNTKLDVIYNKYIFMYKSHISPLCICVFMYVYL